jgi:hypothetical protein
MALVFPFSQIAFLGASLVSIFNTTSNIVIADIPGISAVHRVLVVPDLGRIYASATGTK